MAVREQATPLHADGPFSLQTSLSEPTSPIMQVVARTPAAVHHSQPFSLQTTSLLSEPTPRPARKEKEGDDGDGGREGTGFRRLFGNRLPFTVAA